MQNYVTGQIQRPRLGSILSSFDPRSTPPPSQGTDAADQPPAFPQTTKSPSEGKTHRQHVLLLELQTLQVRQRYLKSCKPKLRGGGALRPLCTATRRGMTNFRLNASDKSFRAHWTVFSLAEVSCRQTILFRVWQQRHASPLQPLPVRGHLRQEASDDRSALPSSVRRAPPRTKTAVSTKSSEFIPKRTSTAVVCLVRISTWISVTINLPWVSSIPL
jgi:hypothetical protein